MLDAERVNSTSVTPNVDGKRKKLYEYTTYLKWKEKISRRWLQEMTQPFPRDFWIKAHPRCLCFNRKAQVYVERMLFTYLFEFSFVNIASPARKKDLNWNSDVGLMSTIPWKWNQWCEIPEGVCFSFTNTTLQPLHKLPGHSSAPWQP